MNATMSATDQNFLKNKNYKNFITIKTNNLMLRINSKLLSKINKPYIYYYCLQ